MKIEKILLIGGTGYIGSALYNYLKDYYIVHICGNEKDYESDDNFTYLNLNEDKTIEAALARDNYDLIVILAAVVKIDYTPGVNFKDPLFQVNVLGLNRLLLKILNLGIKSKLIYISTMTVYDMDASVPVKENSKLNPVHRYGLSKFLAEKLFAYYIYNHDIIGVILRFPGVYGGKRKGGYIYSIINKFKNEEEVIIDTTSLYYWETININDLVEIFLEFITNYTFEQKYDVFNLCYGEETDFIDTANYLKEIIKSNSKINVKNKNYIRFFLDNKKISNYVNTQKFSYLKSLERYVEELN